MFKINEFLFIRYGNYEHVCVGNNINSYNIENIIEFPTYGNAISYIIYSVAADEWLAYNDEYTTVVTFCPFCGLDLRKI